jgi:hypothetical protein
MIFHDFVARKLASFSKKCYNMLPFSEVQP